MPKMATFQIYDGSDANSAHLDSVTLEAGEELLQYTPLTKEGGVWIVMQFDGYSSERYALQRLHTKTVREMKNKNGHVQIIHLETATMANSQFVVTTHVSMVIINRTGLDLSFECQPAVVGESKLEI